MAWRAHMVIIGFASGTIPTIKANYLPVKNISVSGLQWSDYRDRRLEWISKAQTEILAPFLKARVKPYISQQLHLANNAHALATLQEGKAQGKIILTTLL